MTTSIPTGFDFTDPEVWGERRPVEEFAEIRRTTPVWWNAQTPEQAAPFSDDGYWVVSRHEDIKEISKNPEIYSSNRNGAVIRHPSGSSPEMAEVMNNALLINMDPPKHTKIRRIISKGFTPRAVEGLRGSSENSIR